MEAQCQAQIVSEQRPDDVFKSKALSNSTATSNEGHNKVFEVVTIDPLSAL